LLFLLLTPPLETLWSSGDLSLTPLSADFQPCRSLFLTFQRCSCPKRNHLGSETIRLVDADKIVMNCEKTLFNDFFTEGTFRATVIAFGCHVAKRMCRPRCCSFARSSEWNLTFCTRQEKNERCKSDLLTGKKRIAKLFKWRVTKGSSEQDGVKN